MNAAHRETHTHSALSLSVSGLRGCWSGEEYQHPRSDRLSWATALGTSREVGAGGWGGSGDGGERGED